MDNREKLFLERFPGNRKNCRGINKKFCPWVRCSWNVIWIIKPVIKKNNHVFKLTDSQIIHKISRLPFSCVLDMLESGNKIKTLEEISYMWGLTKERIRQIEEMAMFRNIESVGYFEPRLAWQELKPFYEYLCRA